MKPDERPIEGPWAQIGRLLRRVPRQDRARAIVSAILEAAEDGLDVAETGKLQAVFARAGVAAGSFYEYFGSRDALLAAVVERMTHRNFVTLLAKIDAVIEEEEDFEVVVRRCADILVREYLRRPTQLRIVMRVSDRLGLLPHITAERDRFADALAVRAERFAPTLSPDARRAMMRAGCDAFVGAMIVSLYRTPTPSSDDIVRSAGDAGWGVLLVHLRAG